MLSFMLHCRDTVINDNQYRFRWVVCQIDLLQRVKSERGIVQKTLANLPKTLFEAYDRIFLAIPEEARVYVHHTLQWIYYHNELYGRIAIPCKILLQAVEKSVAQLANSQHELYWDHDTLRELCGCLINVSSDESYRWGVEACHTTLVISFAHYTVSEYLDSLRVSESCAAHIASFKRTLKQDFMQITFLEAQSIGPNKVWESKLPSDDMYPYISQVIDELEGNFNSYCVVSALLSLWKWPDEIAHHDSLYTLVIEFLDPSKPHFEILRGAASRIEDSVDFFASRNIFCKRHFWNVTFDPYPDDNDAAQLLRFLIVGMDGGSLALARRFLESRDTKDFLKSGLTFSRWLFDVDAFGNYNEYRFSGSIIEIFAQLSVYCIGPFKLLLEYGTGLFDPSKILPLFMGAHGYFLKDACKESCPLKRLLELGADPNTTVYQVTPLQIAAVSWDFEGVKTLLEAGAGPNNAGNSNGIIWKEEYTLMNRFIHLYKSSPLYICRNFECVFGPVLRFGEENQRKIEAILLQYGAEEFTTAKSI